MKIGKLTRDQVEWLTNAALLARDSYEPLHLGYDDLDQSLKWKVGNGPWSPPIRTEER